MICFRYTILNTLPKGDNKDNNINKSKILGGKCGNKIPAMVYLDQVQRQEAAQSRVRTLWSLYQYSSQTQCLGQET